MHSITVHGVLHDDHSWRRSFDDVHPNTITSANHSRKKALVEESTRRKNVRAMKISPWTLAGLNAEEVSKAAAQARRKSKILQPTVRWTNPMGQETESSMRVAASGLCSSLISAAELTTEFKSFFI